jgi:glucose/arabinose dehydrogenase
MLRFILLLIFPVSAFAAYPLMLNENETTEKSIAMCDGFERVNVGAFKDYCLGLVWQNNDKNTMKKPRSMVQLPNGQGFLIADMGGWDAGKGKVWWLQLNEKDGINQHQMTLLIDKLSLPHRIRLGDDGKIYLGEANKITRFTWATDRLINQQTVIDDLDYWKEHLHPLSQFIFDQQNNIIINAGAYTDDCLEQKDNGLCDYTSTVGLRLYKYDDKTDTWSKNYQQLATGLRNSMAIVQHQSGTLLQAENSIDLDSPNEPYEEINWIQPGKYYGWPYCYNNNAVVDEWRAAKNICANHQRPWTLIPPHVAPLDMIYYPDDGALAFLRGKLLLTWHGYRVVGNRLVAYDVDKRGLPLLGVKAKYFSDPLGNEIGYQRHRMKPEGGFSHIAQHTEIINEWESKSGIRPEGAPVGMMVADDGRVWIVDDKNGAILRLSQLQPGDELTDMPSVTSLSNNLNPTSKPREMPESIQRMFQSECSRCHTEIKGSLLPGSWSNELIKTRINLTNSRKMPLGASLTEQQLLQLNEWLDL